MTFLLPLLVALVPLLITPGLLFHYDVIPKVVVLAVATAAALAFPGWITDSTRLLWARRSGRWFCAAAVAQALWYAIATAQSSRPWFSLLGSNWRRMGLVTVLCLIVLAVVAAAHLCIRPGSLRNVLRGFACAAIAAGLYGVCQYFDIDPFQSVSAYHAQAGDSVIVRPPGTLGHADYFGWWLAIALFCAIGMAREEKGRWRAVAVAATVLSALAIVATGTRAAMLAGAAGFVSLWLLSEFRLARLRLGWKPMVSAVLGLGLIASFYLSPAGARLRARVRWSGEEPLGGARPLLWRDSLRMASARPITGFGPETFAAEFPRYQSAELARLFPAFYHESPHNSFLDVLTSEGIPGVLIAFGAIIAGLYAVRDARRGKHQPLAAALGSALIASLVASLFTAVTLGPAFATLIVLAMLVAISRVDEEPALALRVPTVVVKALAIPIALLLAAIAVELTISDFRLARFQSNSLNAAKAMALYESVMSSSLPGPGEDIYCSRKLTEVCKGTPDLVLLGRCSGLAARAASRATITADNPPNAWYNVAIFAAARNDAAGVERALKTSSELAPVWFKPHWAMANLLALAGRWPEARAEAERAAMLDAGKDAEVNETVKKLGMDAR